MTNPNLPPSSISNSLVFSSDSFSGRFLPDGVSQVGFLRAIKDGQIKEALKIGQHLSMLGYCQIQEGIILDPLTEEHFDIGIDTSKWHLWLLSVRVCPKNNLLELLKFVVEKGVKFDSHTLMDLGIENWNMRGESLYKDRTSLHIDRDSLMFLIEHDIGLNADNAQSTLEEVFYRNDVEFWTILTHYAKRQSSPSFSFLSKTLDLFRLIDKEDYFRIAGGRKDEDFEKNSKSEGRIYRKKEQWYEYFKLGVEAGLPLTHFDSKQKWETPYSLLERILFDQNFFQDEILKVLLDSGCDPFEKMINKSGNFYEAVYEKDSNLAFYLEQWKLNQFLPRGETSKKLSPRL